MPRDDAVMRRLAEYAGDGRYAEEDPDADRQMLADSQKLVDKIVSYSLKAIPRLTRDTNTALAKTPKLMKPDRGSIQKLRRDGLLKRSRSGVARSPPCWRKTSPTARDNTARNLPRRGKHHERNSENQPGPPSQTLRVDYHLVARARLVARKHLQITTTTDALVAACASTRILPPEHKNPDRERSQTGGRNNHDDTGILTASARTQESRPDPSSRHRLHHHAPAQ